MIRKLNNLKAARTELFIIDEAVIYVSPTTTIQSPAQIGYNGQLYNFQMLVPENKTVRFNNPAVHYYPVRDIK